MKYYKFIYFLAFVLGMSTWAQAQSTPCTGNAYSTNADFFRASASAQSGDATASKKKAVIAARTAITSQIKAKAEMAAKSQKNSVMQSGNSSQIWSIWLPSKRLLT